MKFETRRLSNYSGIYRLEYKCFYVYLIQYFNETTVHRSVIKVRHKETEQLVLNSVGSTKLKLKNLLDFTPENILKLAIDNFNLDGSFDAFNIEKLDFEITSYELYIKRKSKNIFDMPRLIVKFKTKKGINSISFGYRFPSYDVKKDNFCLSFNIGVGSFISKELTEKEFFRMAKNNFKVELTESIINDRILKTIDSSQMTEFKNKKIILN